MHSPWHFKKKNVFTNTAQCKNSKRVHTIWKVHSPPPPPTPKKIYIYPDIHFREKRGGGKGEGGDLCSPWYWELFASSLFWLPTIWSRRTSIVAITFLLLLLFIYLKKESSLKTKVKNINLGNYQSACISRLLSIFPQAQYALHTNQYQRPHHRQHARSHLQALPSA